MLRIGKILDILDILFDFQRRARGQINSSSRALLIASTRLCTPSLV